MKRSCQVKKLNFSYTFQYIISFTSGNNGINQCSYMSISDKMRLNKYLSIDEKKRAQQFCPHLGEDIDDDKYYSSHIGAKLQIPKLTFTWDVLLLKMLWVFMSNAAEKITPIKPSADG